MAKIRDVEPKNGYHLLIELDTGRIIYLSMSDKVETVRFHDLKNEAIFNQVETDGYALYWDFGRISISLSEIYEMTSVKRDFIPEQKKSVI
jgi:hypothetical protein